MRTCFCLMVVMLASNMSGIANAGGRPYYDTAVEFLKYDRMLWYDELGSNNANEVFDSRDRVEKELAKSKSPTVDEISQLLRSANVMDRKVALTIIYILGLNSEILYDYIINNYPNIEDFHEKVLYYRCIETIAKMNLTCYEESIYKLLINNFNCEFFVVNRKTLNKLNDNYKNKLYAEYIKTCSDKELWVVKSAILIMGENEKQKLKEYLQNNDLWEKFESIEMEN